MNQRTFVNTIGFSFIFFALVFINMTIAQKTSDSGWKAPASADKLKNPFKDDAEVWKKVEEVYKINCNICHGLKGHGDGLAGIALKPRPANLVSEEVQSQSDGAIFWKLTNGRAPMAPYKDVLTEEQRWQLVNFTRHLAEEEK